MVVTDRDQLIKELHVKVPHLSYRQIGKMFDVSGQRIQQILKKPSECATILDMESNLKSLGRSPISATQAAKITGIPYGVISVWVSRGQVKIVKRPDRKKACAGEPVLLDPVSLQERIDKYRPRKKKDSN